MPSAKILAACAALGLAGCATDPNAPRESSGTAVGAVTGGALGALLGGRGTGSRIAGAVIGAGIGGLLGNRIGASMDEDDRQRAYVAEMDTLERGRPGAPVTWRSERSAYYGTIVPGPYYVERGRRCREFSHTIYINGRPELARGLACRNPDGTWTMLD
jgi:surface antigen